METANFNGTKINRLSRGEFAGIALLWAGLALNLTALLFDWLAMKYDIGFSILTYRVSYSLPVEIAAEIGVAYGMVLLFRRRIIGIIFLAVVFALLVWESINQPTVRWIGMHTLGAL